MCHGVSIASFKNHRPWLCKAITMYSTFPLRTDGSAAEVLTHLQTRNISLDVSSWIPRKRGARHYLLQSLDSNPSLDWLHRSVCQRHRSDMDCTVQTDLSRYFNPLPLLLQPQHISLETSELALFHQLLPGTKAYFSLCKLSTWR